MKILFIYPDLNIDPRWQGCYYEGIASLSAILKSNGHHVDLAHVYNISKSNNLMEQVSAGFDLVAFSSTTPMFPFVQHWSKVIKKRFKDIPLLCGGAHATSAPSQTLKNSSIDYVCVGEGEYFILDFLEYLKGSCAQDDVKNLAYKKESNEIVINELRPPVDPLDDLPFADRELFDFQHRDATVAFVLAGRGCPYKCAYCSNNYLNKIYKNKYLRFRRPETVIRQIRLLLKKYPSIKRLNFLDDIMARHVSDNKIKESIKALKKYDIKFVVDVIFGVPSEEKTHMLDTIKMCAENGVKTKSHIFYPLPATELERIAIEKGLFDRNVYGEDYHSRTILNYPRSHKARILFFHRYSNLLISIYRIFGYSLPNRFSKKFRLYILDKILCSDFNISLIIIMRAAFIKLRSFIRRIFGISEYRLTELKTL